jgi:hypothetical protein
MNPPAWSGQFVVIDWPFTDLTISKHRPPNNFEQPDAHRDRRVMKVTSRRPAESALVVTSDVLAEGQPKTTSPLRLRNSLKIHEPLDKDEAAQPSTLDFWTAFGKQDAAFRQEWALSLSINQQ